MAEHEEQKSGAKTGGHSHGLGVGLDINLQIGGLMSTLDMLTDAVTQTGEKFSDMVANAVQKFREAGPENLKQMKGQSGEQGDFYNRMVSNLQEAANRGEEEARNLLNELGESVEAGGQKMQETARGEEARH